MSKYTAHIERFARTRLPPAEQLPEFLFELPELQYPDRISRDVLAMCELVGRRLLELGNGDVCVGSPPLGFTFGLGALLVFPLACRAATVLVEQPTPDNLRANDVT